MDIERGETEMSYDGLSQEAPQPSTRERTWYRRRAPLVCTALAVIIAGAAGIGIPVAAAAQSTSTASAGTSSSSGVGGATASWSAPNPPTGPGSTGGGYYGGQATSTQDAATAASADESTGVVIIETELGYENGAAAGTGIVLTSDGLILTNNHVVEDSTAISVTIASTGKTYTATVVGTDSQDDVALLRLQGASGLATAAVDDDAETVGQEVTAVGNAEGGGVLMAADGEITDLDATVTTAASGLTASETLDGMIEFAADVVSGDSGGALLDDEGEVVGMTTAASSGSATTVAYAIPIEDALAIVQQILDGDESDGVQLGYPAFLGVAIGQTASAYGYGPGRTGSATGTTATTGAAIAEVIAGTPAAAAGLVAGDTITAIDGVAVADADGLADILSGYDPGDTVTITWTDTAGASHSATVTLVAGPAA